MTENDAEIYELFQQLTEIADDEAAFLELASRGWYCFEADWFDLTLVLYDDTIRINHIQILEYLQKQGLGRLIIETITNFADRLGLLVLAKGVLEEAIVFWEKLGFSQTDDPLVYFRSPRCV